MLENKRLKAMPEDGIEFAEEIATCLEDFRRDERGRYDIGLLCTSEKINKWSKNKPVNYESWAALTPMQRRGNAQDESEGYYWGVKMSAGTDMWLDMHSVDFSYRRPYGGSISPFRALDFDGYDHNAVPTVYGYVSGAFYDVEQSLSVQLDVDVTGWNTTGVDIAEAVWNASLPSEKEQTIGRLYPAVLITDELGNNFAHYLYDVDDHVMTRLYSDRSGAQSAQAKWRRSWYADLRDCPIIKEPLGYDYLVSIFLVGDSGGMNGLDNWVRIRGGEMFTNSAFPLPEATGKRIRLKASQAGDYMPVIASEPNITAFRSDRFIIFVKTSPAATADNPAQVSVNIGEVTLQRTITGAEGVGCTFYWADLNILPVPGQTYAVEVTAVCGGLTARATVNVTAV